MQVKEAVSVAKRYVQEIFSDEKIDGISLEEVELDEKSQIWSVTVAFTRPWEGAPGTVAAQFAAAGMMPRRRDYKVVRLSNADRKMISVKNRELIGE